MEGSGAAMNSNMTGARIAIVGTSMAARRRTASLCICSRRASRMSLLSASSPLAEIDTSFHARREELVGTRRARLGRKLRGTPERFGLAHSTARPRENVVQLLDDHAPPALDDSLNGLHRAGARAHLHREQLVHGVELEPDPRGALGDRPLESSPSTTRAIDESRDRCREYYERGLHAVPAAMPPPMPKAAAWPS